MRAKQKKRMWMRGAKFALKFLKEEEGDIKVNAAKLLEAKGMKYCLRDDHWAKGFVAMLYKKADIENNRKGV